MAKKVGGRKKAKRVSSTKPKAAAKTDGQTKPKIAAKDLQELKESVTNLIEAKPPKTFGTTAVPLRFLREWYVDCEALSYRLPEGFMFQDQLKTPEDIADESSRVVMLERLRKIKEELDRR